MLKKNTQSKKESLRKWSERLTQLEKGITPSIFPTALKMFPKEQRIPYVKNMILSVEEGKRFPFSFKKK